MVTSDVGLRILGFRVLGDLGLRGLGDLGLRGLGDLGFEFRRALSRK